MKTTLSMAVIGLGGRGRGMLNNLLQMEDVRVIGVCDVIQERADLGFNAVKEKYGIAPVSTLDYRNLLSLNGLDAVLITTSWQTHFPIAIDTLNAGLFVASEVGGASSVDECWELIRASKRANKSCMMLENVNYGREELALLNMVKNNVFGEIIHCRCGYQHDLRHQVAMGHVNDHYRIDNYMHRNGDVYPTHGVGPMAKILNINRGNRFTSLVSVASKSRGLRNWISENIPGSEHDGFDFKQGDVVTTIIKCAHGETLMITHDTTLPRPYSRGGYVQGTKGLWMEENYKIYLDGISPEHNWEDFKPYLEKYEHPLWKWFLDEGIKGGHGGMDYLVLRAFVESVLAGIETPIDVYDFATWAAITPLSENSVALGGAPQAFPDFTNGLYLVRPEEDCWKYSLSETWGE